MWTTAYGVVQMLRTLGVEKIESGGTRSVGAPWTPNKAGRHRSVRRSRGCRRLSWRRMKRQWRDADEAISGKEPNYHRPHEEDLASGNCVPNALNHCKTWNIWDMKIWPWYASLGA